MTISKVCAVTTASGAWQWHNVWRKSARGMRAFAIGAALISSHVAHAGAIRLVDELPAQLNVGDDVLSSKVETGFALNFFGT